VNVRLKNHTNTKLLNGSVSLCHTILLFMLKILLENVFYLFPNHAESRTWLVNTNHSLQIQKFRHSR